MLTRTPKQAKDAARRSLAETEAGTDSLGRKHGFVFW